MVIMLPNRPWNNPFPPSGSRTHPTKLSPHSIVQNLQFWYFSKEYQTQSGLELEALPLKSTQSLT
jgi:hypothetical protein